MEDEIIEAGADLIWVLEEDQQFQGGTASACRSHVNGLGSDRGLCVGDGQTIPEPEVFDRSPLAVGRGFDMIVERKTMRIVYSSAGGAQRRLLQGPELLQTVQRLAEAARAD